MLNYIWMGLVLVAVVVGALTGRIDQVTQAAIDMAKLSVEIAIGLIGIMALWLGIMKIAEASGLIRVIARALRPITIRLFPDVPHDHPAIGSIVLNMSANIMGLGNAATPMGLKAMEELQSLNPDSKTASNAMVMFLAINTSSVQLILPATVVALMGMVSSQIFVTTILATLCSTIAAIVIVKVLERTRWFALEPAPEGAPVDEPADTDHEGGGDER